jgi:N-methylhydantoinase B
LVIEPDEIWVGVSSGGGGYGDPLDRYPEQVLMDVSNGIIRFETARQIYGVVIDQTRMVVDNGATEALRAQIRTSRGALPLVTPERSGAAIWLNSHMRPGDQFLLDPQ